MDVSDWSVGLGIGALAASAAAWAWHRQRRLVAELARRLEASEHSRIDLQAHAHQIDDRLAMLTEALARQQAALTPVLARPGASAGPIQDLLHHLGDSGPAAYGRPTGQWIDTQPSATLENRDDQRARHPAFAEAMPAPLASLPHR